MTIFVNIKEVSRVRVLSRRETLIQQRVSFRQECTIVGARHHHADVVAQDEALRRIAPNAAAVDRVGHSDVGIPGPIQPGSASGVLTLQWRLRPSPP